jgi:hypothetical protein
VFLSIAFGLVLLNKKWMAGQSGNGGQEYALSPDELLVGTTRVMPSASIYPLILTKAGKGNANLASASSTRHRAHARGRTAHASSIKHKCGYPASGWAKVSEMFHRKNLPVALFEGAVTAQQPGIPREGGCAASVAYV